MSQCTPKLLPLCSKARPTMKDGWAGRTGRFYLPFSGYYGGAAPTTGGTIGQDQSLIIAGATKANTFTKEGGICSTF